MKAINTVLIMGVLLCGAALADFASLKLRIIDHIKTQGYSNSYIKNNAKSVINEAITDSNDLKDLSRRRSILKGSIIAWAKNRKDKADNRAFLLHIRKAGTDDEIFDVMQRLVMDTGWKGDPNAFLPD